MKIRVSDFVNAEGVEYTLTAENEVERVLLYACVDPELETLKETGVRWDFKLTIPVCNGE